MAIHESFGDTAAVRAFRALMADLSDLVQKELRLARAELAEKLALQIRSGIWFAVAGALAFVCLLLMVEAAVFALANRGVELQWSCLIVAGILAVAAAGAYIGARSGRVNLRLDRTARQFSETVRTAKEQLQ